MLFGSARFAAWLTARGHKSGAEMQKQRDDNIEYFVSDYRVMLEANMDDYIESFDDYMKPK